MANKTVWFDARRTQKIELILPLVYSLNYDYVIVRRDMFDSIKAPCKMKFVVELNSIEELEGMPQNITVLSGEVQLLKKVHEKGYDTALYQAIKDEDDMDLAWKMGREHKFVIVKLTDATNIPLELLIARLQNVETMLLKVTDRMQEAEIAFGVMETGSDGIVLDTESIEEIKGVSNLIDKEKIGKIQLVECKVTAVEHIGMGCRVCVDTTNILEKNEGMLVGSTSRGGILISSETHFLPYMKSRPFRVNAGAVHSYTWSKGGMTQYLTELEGGSKVMAVDTNGNTREISVGRAKTEIRPLLKIEVESNGAKVNAIVQDDWHIRILGKDGKVYNASTIEIGDELLAYFCDGGRHVGIKIDEYLEEK